MEGVGNLITKSEYSGLRKKTPSNDIRKMVNSEGSKIDLVYGYVTDVLEVDHIVSMKEIIDMPEFTQLSKERQIEILNLKDNFIGLGSQSLQSGYMAVLEKDEVKAILDENDIDVSQKYNA